MLLLVLLSFQTSLHSDSKPERLAEQACGLGHLRK